MTLYYRVLKDSTIVRVNEINSKTYNSKSNVYEALGSDGVVDWVLQFLKKGLSIKWENFPDVNQKVIAMAQKLMDLERMVIEPEKKKMGRPKKLAQTV